MPRARNVKHSFFKNDELAAIDKTGLTRLLFIGMWTLADYKGEFEWRAPRVKAELLPYDDCDIKKLAINLDKSGFIRFYSDGEKIYINIPTFLKHQNPHKNEREKGSDIPEYTDKLRQLIDLKGLTINHDKSRLKPECSTCARADSCSLIPESLILNPDCGYVKIKEDGEKTVDDGEAKKPRTKFTKPTLDELKSYIAENGYSVDHEKFYYHYESNGWKVGKNPMKSWQASLVTWNKGNNSKPRGQKSIALTQQDIDNTTYTGTPIDEISWLNDE